MYTKYTYISFEWWVGRLLLFVLFRRVFYHVATHYSFSLGRFFLSRPRQLWFCCSWSASRCVEVLLTPASVQQKGRMGSRRNSVLPHHRSKSRDVFAKKTELSYFHCLRFYLFINLYLELRIHLRFRVFGNSSLRSASRRRSRRITIRQDVAMRGGRSEWAMLAFALPVCRNRCFNYTLDLCV